MVLMVKHRCIVYKRYNYDIWGLCFADWRGSDWDEKTNTVQEKNIYNSKGWLIKFFFKLYEKEQEQRYNRLRRYIYRIDVITRTKPKKRINKRFISLRLARLYFLTLVDYQFRNIFKKASKLDGNLDNNYCMLIECRLLSLFYRTNFMYNLFEIIRFIKTHNVIINFNHSLSYVNAPVPKNAFITFKRKNKDRIKAILLKRLQKEAILFNTPKFLFVSFSFFFAYLCKLPYQKDMIYPISLDISRLTGYGQ